MAKDDDQKYRIDLNRVISDSTYRREILRRLAAAERPPRYRPGAQGKRSSSTRPPRPPRAGKGAAGHRQGDGPG